MNPKTTLILLALAAALGVAWFWTRGGGTADDPHRSAQRLFPDLVEAEVDTILLEDATAAVWGSPVSLSRVGSGWHMKSPSFADGLAVRARRDAVTGLLQGLGAMVPLRIVEPKPDEAALSRLGLAPAQRRRLVAGSKDGSRFLLDLGAIGSGFDVMARVGESGPVYALAKEALSSLEPSLEALEDAAVFTLSPLAVTAIRIQVGNEAPFHATREFSRWFVNEPFRAPGDGRRLDELRNRLLNARILSRRPRDTSGTSRVPVATLRVEASDGPPAAAKLLVAGDDQVYLDVEGEPLEYAVDPGLRAELTRPVGEFREREWIPIAPSEIRELRLKGKHTLHLALTGRHQDRPVHEVLIPSSDPKLVQNRGTDPVRLGNYFELIRKLAFERYLAELPAFDAEWTLEVFGSEGRADLAYEIGPETEGRRFVRRRDERGGGEVSAAALQGLFARPEDVLELYAQGLDAYFRLAEVTVAAGAGEPVRILGSVAEGREWSGMRKSGAVSEPLPASLSQDIVTRLIRLPVLEHRWAPDAAPIAEARLIVKFLVADNATPSGIPTEPKGQWKELRVAPAGPDGVSPATMNTDPPQRFLVDQRSLQPFFDLLRAAGG